MKIPKFKDYRWITETSVLEDICKDTILNSIEGVNPIYILGMLQFIRESILSAKANRAIIVLF